MALRLLLLAFAVTIVRADDEQNLIATIQSQAGIPEKCAACQQLRVIGTTKSIPSLAALLNEDRTGHAARYALEAMPYPEAGAALRAALTTTTGLNKAGIADSLGWRRDKEALPLLIPLLADSDTNVAAAAAGALGKIGGKDAVAALSNAPLATESLLQCAEQLDPAIYRRLFDDAKQPPHIRVAAWRGLALTDTSLIPQALTSTDRPIHLAALKLIRELRIPQVIKACIHEWSSLPADAQLAVLDADASSAVRLAATSQHTGVRIAAWQAMDTIGDATTVSLLIDAAVKATGDEQAAARATLARTTIPGAHEAIMAKLQNADDATVAALGDFKLLLKRLIASPSDALIAALESCPTKNAAAVLAAMNGASVPARCALLRVAGRCGGPEALNALRTGTQDKDPAIRDAAIRALADTGDLAAAPDLLALAKESPELTHRVLALRGYWRVVTLAENRPAAERLKLCEAGLAASARAEEKKLGIAELVKISNPNAIKLLKSYANDESVREEVRRALEASDQTTGYLDQWLVAGPYRAAGKTCAQLFDMAFAPEQSAVTWKPMPVGSPVDLASVVKGDQAVAYLKTRVFVPQAQRVRLEIGSDDGNKVWINGKLVHAKNVMRPLKPGQDKAEADLKQGWNDFLVKITQNNLGCGACVRIRQLDGSNVAGLSCSPTGKEQP